MEKTTNKPQNNFGIMQREMLKYVKGNDLTVYIALLSYTDEFAQCFPSVQTISDETGISTRNVQKHLAQLEDAGWIDRNYRTNTSTLYQLYFVDTSKASKKKAKGMSKSDGASKSDVSPLSLLDRSGVSKSDVSGVSKSDVQTDQLTDHNNKPNNSVVVDLVVKSCAAQKEEKYKLTPEERVIFSELWIQYGEEGEKKYSALSAWTRYCGMKDPVLLIRIKNFLDDGSNTYMTNKMKQTYEDYMAEKEVIRTRKEEEARGELKSL